MFRRTDVAAIAFFAMLGFAICTSGAWAKKALTLREVKTGEEVKAGSEVPAGWFVGLEPKEGEAISCELLPQKYGEELDEGRMKLDTNRSSKDRATGKVAAPRCYSAQELAELLERLKQEEEAAKGGSSSMPRRSEHSSHGSRRLTAPSSEGSGELVLEEMDATKKGSIELSKPFVVHFEEDGAKCAYESKAKISAKWPPKYEGTTEEKEKEEKEFPNLEKTANLFATIKLKASKSNSKTACAKDERAYVEAWLGSPGEELLAEL